ncbi:MAG: DsbA family protein [Rhodobacteraceae bacterium]|nr:DsbA family protein [Paracoccaceae bacterium]
MTLGNADAPVTVIEYGSFTCPHCATFHKDVYPGLKANYIDTGKVRFIYREVYFDRYGLWAGMMARCGGDDKYFGIADMIYQRQDEWLRAGDQAQVADALRRIGLAAGLERETIGACLEDQAKAEALVAEFQKNAEVDNIESTPTLIVNGTKYSNLSYPALAAIIDEELNP